MGLKTMLVWRYSVAWRCRRKKETTMMRTNDGSTAVEEARRSEVCKVRAQLASDRSRVGCVLGFCKQLRVAKIASQGRDNWK